jgi:uncharacterized metal-binding protein YceD (DUF177 family)
MTEFSRPYRVDTLSAEPRGVSIEAGPAEREALAKRFDLQAIARLAAEASLSRTSGGVVASGRIEAEVVQSCVATGEPVPATLDEAFTIEFRPQPEGAGDEVELSETELDVVFYEGDAVDLGEAMAETLALSLDPFPRSPTAAKALREAGVKSEEEEARADASPFAALAGLREKLEK